MADRFDKDHQDTDRTNRLALWGVVLAGAMAAVGSMAFQAVASGDVKSDTIANTDARSADTGSNATTGVKAVINSPMPAVGVTNNNKTEQGVSGATASTSGVTAGGVGGSSNSTGSATGLGAGSSTTGGGAGAGR